MRISSKLLGCRAPLIIGICQLLVAENLKNAPPIIGICQLLVAHISRVRINFEGDLGKESNARWTSFAFFNIIWSNQIFHMDQATVIKVAKLARIKLSPDRLDLYVKEISKIMTVIDDLKAADTTSLEPLVNVNEASQASMREDIVTDGDRHEQVLKNAPQQKFGYFAVPKVIE
jgi:aspartyl-tRNA(Asn)/glutamyl-tRNA(Gln) amidotransferase subunit C